MEQILDLTDPQTLHDFLALIKRFKLSKPLLQKAKKLKYPCEVIGTLKNLMESLLLPACRTFPKLYDVPANPQIFGQIALSAGTSCTQTAGRRHEVQPLIVGPTSGCRFIAPPNAQRWEQKSGLLQQSRHSGRQTYEENPDNRAHNNTFSRGQSDQHGGRYQRRCNSDRDSNF